MTKSEVKTFLSDAIHTPQMGRGIICVWRRNFLYFQNTLFTTMAWIFMEPLLYLFALGYGLGRYVAEINGLNYAEFIAPAMMATSGMFVAFFEGTYATYTKMNRQQTYQTIILTPVSAEEIVLGEILWVTSKAFLSVISVAAVLFLMGLVPAKGLPPALLMLLLMCWVFASVGVWLASLARSYEWFSYAQSGFVTPMSLFCGTYFPLAQLPDFFVYAAYTLPLTHGLMSVRMFFGGGFDHMFFINLAYLVFTGLLFTNLASARFVRKLII